MVSDGVHFSAPDRVTVVVSVNLAPVMVATMPKTMTLMLGTASMKMRLSDYMADPENDALTFSLQSSNSEIVQVHVNDEMATLAPMDLGISKITMAASDGFNETSHTMRIKVMLDPTLGAGRELLSEYALNLTDGIMHSISERLTGPMAATNGWIDPDGSSFALPFRNKKDTDPVGEISLWGRANRSSLSKTADMHNWQGNTESQSLGVDGVLGESTVLGVLLTRMDALFDASSQIHPFDSLQPTLANYESKLINFHPYVGWSKGNFNLWGAIGTGHGTLHTTIDRSSRHGSGLRLNTAQLGASGLIAGRNTKVRFKTELMTARLRIASDEFILAGEVEAQHMRMSMEAEHSWHFANGGELSPSLELGLRRRGGEGMVGQAAELGAALRYQSLAAGISLEIGGRTLIATDESYEGYEESGVHLALRIDAGRAGRGLALSLQPSRGDTNSGMGRLWEDDLQELLRDEPSIADDADLLDAEISYGISLPQGALLLTPYSTMRWSDDSNRDLELGARLNLDDRMQISLHTVKAEQNPERNLNLQASFSF